MPTSKDSNVSHKSLISTEMPDLMAIDWNLMISSILQPHVNMLSVCVCGGGGGTLAYNNRPNPTPK